MNGEILVGGKTLGKMSGSGEKLNISPNVNRWYHSGDAGRIDVNKSLFVTGRLDNMFISGGENIHPEEIEAALLSLENVSAACVVGVPDNRFGEKAVAYVQLRSDDHFNVNYLRSGLEGILPRFKIPKTFIPWKPDSASLKPDRKALRNQAIAILKNS
jgi:O-succinylbenzoic acid--CoA ligase